MLFFACFELQAGVMNLGNARDDGKPEAGTCLLAAGEADKSVAHLLPLLDRNARALVEHFKSSTAISKLFGAYDNAAAAW